MVQSTTTFLFVISLLMTITRAGDLSGHYEGPLRAEFYDEITCPKTQITLFDGKIRYLWVSYCIILEIQVCISKNSDLKEVILD